MKGKRKEGKNRRKNKKKWGIKEKISIMRRIMAKSDTKGGKRYLYFPQSALYGTYFGEKI